MMQDVGYEQFLIAIGSAIPTRFQPSQPVECAAFFLSRHILFTPEV